MRVYSAFWSIFIYRVCGGTTRLLQQPIFALTLVLPASLFAQTVTRADLVGTWVSVETWKESNGTESKSEDPRKHGRGWPHAEQDTLRNQELSIQLPNPELKSPIVYKRVGDAQPKPQGWCDR